MTPTQYVRSYHNLWSPEYVEWYDNGGIYGWNAVSTPVREYLNTKYNNYAGLTPHERNRFKDYLIYDFIATVGKKAGSGLSLDGLSGKGAILPSTKVSLTNTVRELYDYPVSDLATCMVGKGTPEQVEGAIQILAFWRGYMTVVKDDDDVDLTVKVKDKKTGAVLKKYEKEFDVLPLPRLVEQFLGMDCNGLVGNYLRQKYPSISYGPNTTEVEFSKAKTKRKTPSDLHSDDVIVFKGAGGNIHHVAVIDSVVWRGDDYALIILAESRTGQQKHGGPQYDYWTIEQVKDKHGKAKEGEFIFPGRPESTSRVQAVVDARS